jgi:hypothetical protein
MLNPDIPQTLLSRIAFRRQMLLQAAARRDHLVAELKVILPKTAAVPPSMHFTEAQRILTYESSSPPAATVASTAVATTATAIASGPWPSVSTPPAINQLSAPWSAKSLTLYNTV